METVPASSNAARGRMARFLDGVERADVARGHERDVGADTEAALLDEELEGLVVGRAPHELGDTDAG